MGGSLEGKRDSTSGYAPGPAFERVAEGDFHRRMATTGGVAVVLFSAPRCGACRVWKQTLPVALGELANSFYEVDVSEATGVARHFDIFHLPTIYLYRDGRFHAELQCEARAEVMRDTTRGLLSAAAEDEPG
jgi:thioredoxin-like negative regulator of GroEL